jgi:hypothetical protein
MRLSQCNRQSTTATKINSQNTTTFNGTYLVSPGVVYVKPNGLMMKRRATTAARRPIANIETLTFTLPSYFEVVGAPPGPTPSTNGSPKM